jgi:hypothetical protein
MNDAIPYLTPSDLHTLPLRSTCHNPKKTVQPLGFRVFHQMQAGLKILIATDSVYQVGLGKIVIRFVFAMISSCKVT